MRSSRLTALVVLVALAALAAALALTLGSARAHPAGSPLPPPPNPNARALHPPVAADAAYRRLAVAAVASRLHSTIGQLRAQLAVAPGLTLMNLGKPLGLAEDQLATVVRAGLDSAADANVRAGRWSRATAAKEKSYWNVQPDPDLISEISSWLTRA
jgi:hypothetical protein